MSQYLFIESQDPLEDRGACAYLETALDVRRADEPVTVYLVENGAHAARAGARCEARDALLAAGASVRVDGFALEERGIRPERLAPGIEVGSVEHIVDLLADGATKAVWH